MFKKLLISALLIFLTLLTLGIFTSPVRADGPTPTATPDIAPTPPPYDGDRPTDDQTHLPRAKAELDPAVKTLDLTDLHGNLKENPRSADFFPR